jgi:hypothetical protein
MVNGEAGRVLSLLTDDGDPVGRRNEVSYDASRPSSRAKESTEGDGWRMDESYERLVLAEGHRCTRRSA